MFRNTFQTGFISIFYSIGSKPLELWRVQADDGVVRFVTDDEIDSKALELTAANVATTFITCPADPTASLGIKLPVLVLLIKNSGDMISTEVEVQDDKKEKRRFRASTFQHSICTMPLRLSPGWNEVRFDLAEFLHIAYGTALREVRRVALHGTCRVRRIYFADKNYNENEIPSEFKLFKPARRNDEPKNATQREDECV